MDKLVITAGIAIAMVLAYCVVPSRVRLSLLSTTSFLNPAISIFGVWLCNYGSIVAGLTSPMALRVRLPGGILLGGALIVFGQLASIVWSPDPNLALNVALESLTFFIAALLYLSLLRDRFTEMWRIGPWLPVGLLGILQGLSTVLFRFSPEMESDFYRSRLSRLTLGAAGNALYTSDITSNNVVDPARAGGIFFVNCNRASMLMGIILVIYLALYALFRRRFHMIVVVSSLSGILAANSKTGLSLLVMIPALCMFLTRISGRASGSRVLGAIFGGILGSVLTIWLVLIFGNSYLVASSDTLIPRKQLWSEAWLAITQNPVWGLGFGGWEERWQSGRVRVSFLDLPRPAHNIVLQTWLDAGLIALMGAVILGVCVLRVLLESVRVTPSGRTRFAICLLFGSLLWSFIHGLGDNTDIFGSIQAAPLLGAALALMLQLRDPSTQRVLDADSMPDRETSLRSQFASGQNRMNARTPPVYRQQDPA